MKLRQVLLGTAMVLGSASGANAAIETPTGWYLSLGAGANWIQDGDLTSASGFPTAAYVDVDDIGWETGYVVAGAVGYDFGPHWRAEFEVAYRNNDGKSCNHLSPGTPIACTGPVTIPDVWELSQMVNVLYDFPLGGNFSASLGAGVGGNLVVLDYGVPGVDYDDYVFAGQLIGELGYQLSSRWQAFASYRFMMMEDPEFGSGVPKDPITGLYPVSMEKIEHSVIVGLRFDLQRDSAPPPPKEEPPPAKPEAPKQFIVFFGFNKSNLTPEAARVVSDAAEAAKEYGSASISIVGHTDTSGSKQYNLRLSMRRAQAVKDGLVDNGIPASAVSTSGRGEDELMVETGDGVKEPQNRRATIDLN